MARRRKSRASGISEISFSWRGLETIIRLFVAYVLLGLLFLLNLTALPIPHAGVIKPDFVLMAVYYWAIFRPRLIPTWLCFGAGILLDVLSLTPPGLQAFILVLAQSLVRDQRKFLMAQPYISLWAIFGFVAMMAAGIQWGLFGLVNDMQWPAIMPVAIRVLVTLCLFPVVTMALIGTHRFLSPAQNSYP
ncbi:MAG: rod shape-determining protein MreD [Micavibrio aeruginosavorus]|uniref:Rod shape-determining protein MreD n=1 Tax=Micavibrio aeruginosavorus TaxID=349221 RepID=A0A7T5R1X3_9BACT|nr:MAG: rod shape-determining protein MreD [Micavibrio aeruginosavorus]